MFHAEQMAKCLFWSLDTAHHAFKLHLLLTGQDKMIGAKMLTFHHNHPCLSSLQKV
jgi:hypothetical protein